jgi:predicted enzyme related to lactoylglutathione lyase
VDASPDGGLLPQTSSHNATNYVNVESVDKFAAKVGKLGGKICMPNRCAEDGLFCHLPDTENNEFGIWEIDRNAKRFPEVALFATGWARTAKLRRVG